MSTVIKKSKSPGPPRYHGVAIPACPGPLSKANVKAVSDYHQAGRKFDAELAELLDRHAAMMEQGPGMKLRDIRKLGDELVEERDRLLDVLIDLRWRRFAIIPKLVPDFEKAAAAYKLANEQGFILAADRFAKEGITARSMPSGGTNLRAAEVQFRRRLELEVEVLRTVIPMKDSKDALQSIQSEVMAIPRWSQTFIKWPAPSGEFSDLIATAARLDQSYPMPSESAAFKYVADELGFSNSPLMRPVRDAISGLVDSCKVVPGSSRPISGACRKMRDPSHVLNAVVKLPRTREISKLLQHLKSSDVQFSYPNPM